MTVETYDVVVVGGGGSGLAAAIEAAGSGRSVVLLEKSDRLGGSTAKSVGSVTVTNSPHQLRKGIRDSPAHHLEDLALINAKSGLESNRELGALLVNNITDTFQWLMELGVEFYGPIAEPPHRKPRMHNVLPNSRAFIYNLARRARRVGVRIVYGARARELTLEEGRVTGIRAETANGTATFAARGGVVLASGDFAANPDLVDRYLPRMRGVASISSNTGEGHAMVLALGGRIVYPHLYQGGIRFELPPPSWVTSLPPYRIVSRAARLAMDYLPARLLRPLLLSFLTTYLVPDAALYRGGAILVNRNGARFVDETNNPAQALLDQPDQRAYILLDARLVAMFSAWPNFVSTAPGVAYAYVGDYRRSRKDVYHDAPSVASLGKALGMPPGALEATIAAFDARERGTRPAFGEGPYVALGPVRFMLSTADSGVAVNDKLQVLGRDDRPVEGLFAAGLVGMGGGLLEGHGHHLGWAFTSGRIAGRNAAHRAVTADPPREG